MSLYFQFDFKDDETRQPLILSDPIDVWQTNEVKEVLPLLKKVEAAHKQGLYVAGYLSYESAPAFSKHFDVKSTREPLLLFASFEAPSDIGKVRRLPYYAQPWQISEDYLSYQDKISRIKSAIKRGDTYQVNYTTQFNTIFLGDPYAYYLTLKNKQQSNYSAYLKYHQHHILSLSPELFFKVNQSHMITKPMKGTSKRGETKELDQQNKQHLISSEKERAENMMIVDLLRNDLGRIAKPGTVKVSELLTVETYPTVHQMTSTIEAEVDQKTSLTDWFKALFPCGSITGAPKVKTMSYIKELEDAPRNVYCGTIGYLTPNKQAVFNVPIRTILLNEAKQNAVYGVGGGITWDSVDVDEYDEIKTKAKVLDVTMPTFDLLESLCLDNGKLQRFNQHMLRLERTAKKFGYRFNFTEILEKMTLLEADNPKGIFKVRLLLNKQGDARIEMKEISPLSGPIICHVSKQAIPKNHLFSRFKTTYRDHYQACEVQAPDNFSTLLYNEENELTEFTIGNVMFQINGELVTPPLSSGCLPGVYRQHLIEQGKAREKTVTLSDLDKVEKVYLTNSVRGMMEVQVNLTHS